MDGRKDQILLIDQWIACQVTQSFGRIESQVTQEALARRMVGTKSLELLQISDAHARTFVESLQVRFVPFAYHVDLALPLGGIEQGAQQRGEAR